LRLSLFFLAATVGVAPAALSRAASPDPAPFDAVLAARARGGGFDFRGATGQDKKRLAEYLANVVDADAATMSADERKAFYINAYNALAIQTLLDNPGKKIIDVPGAFNRRKHRVAGEMLTLDDIENRLRAMRDARIHFAIVCVSRSCPSLRPRAYTAEGLGAALDLQGREFLSDPVKNVLDRIGNRLALSKIFEWDRKEFERDGGGSLLRFVARFVADAATAEWVASYPREPEFLKYDWRPNQP
jgi:hypothetical protein